LALIIEKVTGRSYPVHMDRTIFKPLGMNDTYVFQIKDTATAIPSYDWKGTLMPFNYLDGIYGDKNIYSTARDLYRWDQALYTNAIVSQQSLDAAYTPYSFEKPGVKNYGLGWRMFVFPDNKKIVFHNGWWHGNNNAFQRLIQDSATIICLGNRFSRSNYSVLQLSYLFGNYPFELEVEEKDSAASIRDSLLLKKLKLKADSVKAVRSIPKINPPKKKDSVPKQKAPDSMSLPGNAKDADRLRPKR
jgi:CubicO group peptidase (beta-lactamase class C family)